MGFDFKNKRECLCLFVGQVKTSKKITNHSKTYGAPELIGAIRQSFSSGAQLSSWDLENGGAPEL